MTYSPMKSHDSMERWGQKNGGPAKQAPPRPQRAPNSSRGSSSSQHNLPAWLLSAIEAVTGREAMDIRKDLPFLQNLRETLPRTSRDATLYHIPSSWCANGMANDTHRTHDKNGTVFAVDERLGVVYATCSTGAGGHKITENNSQCIQVVNMYSKTKEDGTVEPVEKVTGKCVHWVMADETTMGLLVKKGKSILIWC